jgi:peptidoglycan-associated lipoprotein
MKMWKHLFLALMVVAVVMTTGAGCSLFDNSDPKQLTGTIPPPIGGDPDEGLDVKGDPNAWGKGANDGSLNKIPGEFTADPRYAGLLKPVYFDFDKDNIKPGEQGKISAGAKFLQEHPDSVMIIEGNCDDRGTEEYNRALGERRAIAVRNALQAAGVQDDRMKTISYGKDRPAVEGNSEDARAKNRRGELVPAIKNK